MKKKEVKNYFREIRIFMRVSMGKNIKKYIFVVTRHFYRSFGGEKKGFCTKLALCDGREMEKWRKMSFQWMGSRSSDKSRNENNEFSLNQR